MKELTRSTLVAIVASSLSLLAFYAVSAGAQSAWTPAPANAPSGNVAGPLTTGATGQSKAGNLMLNTDGTLANGLIVANGNVGIGTVAPYLPLVVYSSSANGSAVALDRPAGLAGMYQVRTNGSPRWVFGADQTTESGSNSGSNFRIIGYNDDGLGLNNALTINRSSGNVGIGTTNPNVSKGAGGYVDAKDVYLRDAGKWASEVGGSGSIVAGCAKNRRAVDFCGRVNNNPAGLIADVCWGGASFTTIEIGTLGADWGASTVYTTKTFSCPSGSTVRLVGTMGEGCGSNSYSSSSVSLDTFFCIK